MIVLRQKEFGDKAKKKAPKIPQTEEELREVLKAERDKGFKNGVAKGEEQGREEVFNRLKAERNKKKAIQENGKKLAAWGKKNKKALILTGSGIAASGLVLAGVNALKKHKIKKASEDLKKKVRGYDNTKEKA